MCYPIVIVIGGATLLFLAQACPGIAWSCSMTSLYEGVSKEQNNIYVLDYIKNRDLRFYDLNVDEPDW